MIDDDDDDNMTEEEMASIADQAEAEDMTYESNKWKKKKKKKPNPTADFFFIDVRKSNKGMT